MNKKDEEDWWRLLALICKVQDPSNLNEFLKLLLTLSEKEEISRRYTIIKELLLEKKTQRDIADKCGVSISKITRGSNALKIIKPSLKEFILKNL